jgi:hypothetical protein
MAEDEATLEVVAASACGDATEVSSSFDWNAMKDVPVLGCGDHTNSETEASDDDVESNSE